MQQIGLIQHQDMVLQQQQRCLQRQYAVLQQQQLLQQQQVAAPQQPPPQGTVAEKGDCYNRTLRAMALGLLHDPQCRPMREYCRDHKYLCSSLHQLILSEGRLQFVLQGKRRQQRPLLAEATAIVRRRCPTREADGAERGVWV